MIPFKNLSNSNLDLHLTKQVIYVMNFSKFIKISSGAQERKKFFYLPKNY